MNTKEITSLTAQEAAELVKENKGFYLELDSLTSLSVEVARELSKHNNYLYLNGLRSLSVEVARELARHNNHLHIYDLASLRPEVASALIGVEWHYFLLNTGIKRCNKHIDLRGLREKSYETRQELKNAPFRIYYYKE